MAKIKIDDLPKDTKISKDEMKRVLGGMTKTLYTSPLIMGKNESSLELADWNPDTWTVSITETSL